MLSAIIHRITGRSLLDYLQPRLFAPLGIERPPWVACPRGINVGGWGLSLRTEDIARFGQLYLQKGMWHGRRLLPAAWIEAAIASQVPNAPSDNLDWEQGYGYQFWQCRNGAVRGDGAFGQFCILLPEQDAVLAITSGVGDMQAVLDLAWEYLLPAFQPATLPAAPAAHDELQDALASLSIPPLQAASQSPLAAQISGKRYALDKNEAQIESLQFGIGADACTITSRSPQGDQTVVCGNGAWHEGTMADERGIERRYVASGGWIGEDTYQALYVLYQAPFCGTVTARFEGDRISYQHKTNVSFGPAIPPTLTGRASQEKQG
jgi:hypothetical protein